MDSLLLARRFAHSLRRNRQRAGLTQEDLAALTGLHRTYISQLERGGPLPRLDTILKVSAGVEASPCVLLAGLRWRPGYYVEGGFYIEDDSELRGVGRHDPA